MKTDVTTTVVITLVLSPEEAAWLNAVMQNPLHDVDPINEPKEDAEMRLKFWEATKSWSS